MYLYIEKTGNKWVVRLKESNEIMASYYSKQRAIEYAKEIALVKEAELLIPGIDGKIDNLNEFGADPSPWIRK